MPNTAIHHFREDINRARAIVVHTKTLPGGTPGERMLRSDLLRGAWMFAVGSLDAYFCDAYTHLIAISLRAKQLQPAITLPEFFYNIKLPVRAILDPYTRPSWRWRMAARKLMERENILSLDRIRTLFNGFLRDDRRFYKDSLLDDWIAHPASSKRLFVTTSIQFAALNLDAKRRARVAAKDQLEERLRVIFQRRHDCIHNCDRPKTSPQPLESPATVLRVAQDIEFFVERSDEHIDTEFRLFLSRIGSSPTTIAQVGY